MADFKDLFDISVENAEELESVFREAVARRGISAPGKQLLVEEAVLHAFRHVPIQEDGRIDQSSVVLIVLTDLESRGML